MRFQVGDLVRRTTCENKSLGRTWRIGDEGRVTRVSRQGIYVGGDFWCREYAQLVTRLDIPHTDADLAMALRLAELLDDGKGYADGQEDINAAMWLRRQVRQHLQERG